MEGADPQIEALSTRLKYQTSTLTRLTDKALCPFGEQGLIDDVHRMTLEKCFQVRGCSADQAHAPFLGRPRDVRGYEAVLCMQQGIIERRGFAREYIDTGARKTFLIERIRQVLLYNKRSARGVDQKACRLHPRQGGSIDDSPRLRQKRTVQAHHICGSHQLVRFAPFKAGPSSGSIFSRFVAGYHPHPHDGRNLSDPPADTPEPDDSDGLVFQLDQRSFPKAEIPAPRPFTRATCLAVQRHVMTKFEQECEHQLSLPRQCRK
jgi:hypothetical protein